MSRTGLFQFVRHHDVPEFHQRGWMVVDDLGARHGLWSVLMWHASFTDCERCRDEN